jgi:hypothetical protein
MDMQSDLTLASSCEQTIARLISTMALHGIRLERSFDLRTALHDQPDCPYPHHGTAQCSCQYVVLLAYGRAAASAPPAVLTAHECDGITRVNIVASPPGERLSWPLLAALDEALVSVTADD